MLHIVLHSYTLWYTDTITQEFHSHPLMPRWIGLPVLMFFCLLLKIQDSSASAIEKCIGYLYEVLLHLGLT